MINSNKCKKLNAIRGSISIEEFIVGCDGAIFLHVVNIEIKYKRREMLGSFEGKN